MSSRPRALPWGCVLVCAVAVFAWWYPAPKNDAVLGRLSYAQFWFAVVATITALSFGFVAATRPPLRRAIGFRLTALWLGTGIAVGLVEGIVWWLPVRHQMDNPWYLATGGGVVASVELPFERPPGLRWEGLSRGDLALMNGDPDPYARRVTFQTDRHGFRNSREIEQADIVVIGDSFTEAGNLPEEESFSSLLGRKLDWTSRNLGRAGYSPPTELVLLRRYGLECRPKVVVWQITESNDLDESLRFQEWVAAGRPRFFDADLDRQVQRSKAWQQRSPTFRAFALLRQHGVRPWLHDGTFRDAAGTEHPMRFLDAPDLNRSLRDHPGWPPLVESLTAGAALCRSNQIRLQVVFVPTKYRVMGPFTEMPGRTRPDLRVAAGEVKNLAFGRLLKHICDSFNIPLVDATGALLARAQAGELVYLPYDTHLSPLGHEVVAEVVVEKLRSFEPAAAADER